MQIINNKFYKKLLLLFFFFIACYSIVFVKSYAVGVTDIAKLINKRLSYMESIALFKYNNQILVEDLSREKIILENISQKANEYKLDSTTLVVFFKEQISSAKDIQYRLLDQWRLSQPLANNHKVNLKTEIRPKLDEINQTIIDGICQIIKDSNNIVHEECYDSFACEITTANLPEISKEKLFYSLINAIKVNTNLGNLPTKQP